MKDNGKMALILDLGLIISGFITFLVLLILKLTNTVNIKWGWVFFPLWLPAAIILLFIILGIFCALIILGKDEEYNESKEE